MYQAKEDDDGDSDRSGGVSVFKAFANGETCIQLAHPTAGPAGNGDEPGYFSHQSL